MSKSTRKRTPSRFVNFIFLAVAVICFAYYLLNGIIVRFGQSLLWVWLVAGAALLARWVIVARMIRTGRPSPIPRAPIKIMHILLALLFAFFVFVECVILSDAFETAPDGMDYIIVLGAKVNGTQPSGALKYRIIWAYNYLEANPDTLVIASGGQGDDEDISEAECIRRELVARGTDASRIIMEDKSTSTAENLEYSLSLIDSPTARVGIVTNDFHVYRAKRIAQNMSDLEFHALYVPTSLISFPHYMMREFVTVVVDTLRGNI